MGACRGAGRPSQPANIGSRRSRRWRAAHKAPRALENYYLPGDLERQIEEDRVAKRTGTLRGRKFGLQGIVWIGIILSVFQQFVGINVIFYYSTTLWRAVGFSEDQALLTSVITSVTNILTTLVAITLIDRIGRKPLLLIGAAGMFVTLGTMAICFATASGSG